jgi:hypothetical protein
LSMEELIRRIPVSLWNIASERLIDIVLNSPQGSRMSSDLAKTILFYWQRDQLATEIGLQKLIEAAMTLEPEKTVSLMEEFGLWELATVLTRR